MKITVVIPIRNGAATLDKCLSSIRKQTIGKDLEIIILDSMSTDNSTAICEPYDVSIVKIPAGTFNHGLTRNIGVHGASGDLLFFTVQDAWLAETDMLERMSAHFSDASVTSVSGHQAVPHEKDKNPVQWFRRYSQPVVEIRPGPEGTDFSGLAFKEQMRLIAWDNVVSMYRRSSLLLQPFVATEFAEDCIWVYQAMEKGWRVAYDPSLVVYHYHYRNYAYSYKVAFALNYHLYKFFKKIPAWPKLFTPAAKATYHLIKNNQLGFKEKIGWIGHNYAGIMGNFFSEAYFRFIASTQGLPGLTKAYDRICRSVPQGFQKRSNKNI